MWKKIFEPISTALANSSDETAASYSLFVVCMATPTIQASTEVKTITDSKLLCTVGCYASSCQQITGTKQFLRDIHLF